MKSFKIDLRGLSGDEKNAVAENLRKLGYVGVPYPENFFYYCIYASGTPSKHGYSLSFGNNMGTFSKNKGIEITVKQLVKLL